MLLRPCTDFWITHVYVGVVNAGTFNVIVDANPIEVMVSGEGPGQFEANVPGDIKAAMLVSWAAEEIMAVTIIAENDWANMSVAVTGYCENPDDGDLGPPLTHTPGL